MSSSKVYKTAKNYIVLVGSQSNISLKLKSDGLVQYSRKHIFIILQESIKCNKVSCGIYNFLPEPLKVMYTEDFLFPLMSKSMYFFSINFFMKTCRTFCYISDFPKNYNSQNGAYEFYFIILGKWKLSYFWTTLTLQNKLQRTTYVYVNRMDMLLFLVTKRPLKWPPRSYPI